MDGAGFTRPDPVTVSPQSELKQKKSRIYILVLKKTAICEIVNNKKLNKGFLEQKYLTDMFTYAWYCAGSLAQGQVCNRLCPQCRGSPGYGWKRPCLPCPADAIRP